jgi:hypothetical protein
MKLKDPFFQKDSPSGLFFYAEIFKKLGGNSGQQLYGRQ